MVLFDDRGVDLADIVQLIHRVNPTDAAISEADRARRYALKARLQSLLIRRYGEHLVVEPVPRDPEIVTLHHRLTGRDAGHARLEALDEDARVWIRRRLVEAELPAEEPRSAMASPTLAPPGSGAPADPLSRGRAALEEYDYEQAQACFEEALRAGSAPAGVELVSLLVEHLGLDAEALALAERLPTKAARAPEARALLALAAGREGRAAAVATYLAGLSGSPVAEARAALADRLLRGGDREGGEAALVALRDVSPHHQAIPRLEDRVRVLRADARRPAEARLQALLDEGDMAAIEAAARALLACWPASAAARRALAAVERAEAEAARAERLAAAAQAEAQGDLEGSLERLIALRGDPSVEVRIEVLRERIAARARSAAVEEVRAELARGRQFGWLAWMALEDGARASLASEVGEEIAGWLEALRAALPTRRYPEAIAAVLAHEAATAAWAAGDPEGALAALEASELTGRIRSARRLTARAKERLLSQAQQQRDEHLTEARAAFTAGDLEAAARALGAAGVTAEDGGEAGALAARVAEARAVAARRARFDALEAAGDLLGAREMAAAMAREEGGVWAARADALGARLREAWRLQVLEGEDLGHFDDHRLVAVPTGPNLRIPEGRDIVVLAECRGQWLMLREIDLDTSRVRRVILLQTPARLEMPHVRCEGDAIWIIGRRHALALRRDPCDILRWYDPGAAEGEAWEIALSPGGQRLLVMPPGRSVQVLGTDTLRQRRRLPAATALRPVPASDPPMVLVEREDEVVLHAFTPRHRRLRKLPMPSLRGLTGDGPGRLVFLAGFPEGTDTDSPAHMVECTLADGLFKRVATMASQASLSSQLVRAGAGRVWTLIGRPDKRWFLACYRRGQGRWWEAARHEVRRHVVLVGDLRGERAAVIGWFGDHLQLRRLDRDEALEVGPLRGWGGQPVVVPPFNLQNETWLAALVGEARRRLEAAGRGELSATLPPELKDEPMLVAAWLATRQVEGDGASARVQALGHFPDHPLVRLVAGWTYIEAADWEGARSMLEGTAPEDPDIALHWNFYRGLVRLHARDLRGALVCWLEGRDHRLECFAAYLEELLGVGEADTRRRRWPGVCHIVRRILDADARSDRGDHRGVIEALDSATLWNLSQPQIDARRAAAWASLEPRSMKEALAKWVALSGAVETMRGHPPDAPEGLPLGEATWSRERLEAVCQSAADWLDRPGDPARHGELITDLRACRAQSP